MAGIEDEHHRRLATALRRQRLELAGAARVPIAIGKCNSTQEHL